MKSKLHSATLALVLSLTLGAGSSLSCFSPSMSTVAYAVDSAAEQAAFDLEAAGGSDQTPGDQLSTQLEEALETGSADEIHPNVVWYLVIAGVAIIGYATWAACNEARNALGGTGIFCQPG